MSKITPVSRHQTYSRDDNTTCDYAPPPATHHTRFLRRIFLVASVGALLGTGLWFLKYGEYYAAWWHFKNVDGVAGVKINCFDDGLMLELVSAELQLVNGHTVVLGSPGFRRGLRVKQIDGFSLVTIGNGGTEANYIDFSDPGGLCFVCGRDSRIALPELTKRTAEVLIAINRTPGIDVRGNRLRRINRHPLACVECP